MYKLFFRYVEEKKSDRDMRINVCSCLQYVCTDKISVNFIGGFLCGEYCTQYLYYKYIYKYICKCKYISETREAPDVVPDVLGKLCIVYTVMYNFY